MEFKTDLGRLLDLTGTFMGILRCFGSRAPDKWKTIYQDEGNLALRYIGGDLDRGFSWEWTGAPRDEQGITLHEQRMTCTLKLEASAKTKQETKQGIRCISQSISAATRQTGTDVIEMARVISLFLLDQEDCGVFSASGTLTPNKPIQELSVTLSAHRFSNGFEVPFLSISDKRSASQIYITEPPTLLKVAQQVCLQEHPLSLEKSIWEPMQ
jgi:hypothetical protein